jgi:SNF2 family DNA or RNA helicase
MPTDVLDGYKPRLPLMSHQLAAITASRNAPPVPVPEDVFAYLMDMGTGKSAALLADWASQSMNGGTPDLLIVAPAGSYRNWWLDKGDDEENWCEYRKHLDPGLYKRMLQVPWISGKSTTGPLKRRTEALLGCKDPKRQRVITINVEALSSVKAAQDLAWEFVQQRGAMVAIDESTVIKNGSADRTRFLVNLGAQSHAKRILSGLWSPNSPMDVYSQCLFLDERILRASNEWAFKYRYAVIKPQKIYLPGKDAAGKQNSRTIKQIVAFKNLDELQAKVAQYSYRVRAEDCLDLPEKVYVPRDVPLLPEQKRVLSDLKSFGHAQVGDGFVTVDMVIKMITRRIQVNCGYVVDDEGKFREIPEKRTDVLLEVLQDNPSEKAVIWCPWKPPLFKIIDRLKKQFGPQAVAQWHGGNVNTRSAEERRFINDPDCLYMCATQGAGMRGNTWVKPALVIYYANNYDLEQRDQSERRTWRKGQHRPVTYVDLLTENTIDWDVVRSLRKKLDLATLMNQEEFRKWLI